MITTRAPDGANNGIIPLFSLLISFLKQEKLISEDLFLFYFSIVPAGPLSPPPLLHRRTYSLEPLWSPLGLGAPQEGWLLSGQCTRGIPGG